MRIATMMTLLIVLIAGGLAFSVSAAGEAAAADMLEGTCWEDDGIEVCFKSGGYVAYDDMFDRKMSGTYVLNGNSVSFSFGGWPRAKATVNGNKMSGTWQEAADKEPFDFTLTKRK